MKTLSQIREIRAQINSPPKAKDLPWANTERHSSNILND